MVVELKQHIELKGNSPLAAIIAGTNLKAYLVANLALVDGVDAAMTHYNISHADVYAALTFRYDNESAIQAALSEADKWLEENAQKMTDFREEILRRQQK